MSLPQPPFTQRPGLDDDALDWFVRRTGGGFGTHDEAAFQAWHAADARHRNAYARQQAVWAALDRLPADQLDILRANLAHDLTDDLGADAVPASPPGRAVPVPQWPGRRSARVAAPTRRRFLVPAVSAAAVALVAGGAGFMAWHHGQTRPLFAQRFSTQRGQQLEVPLSDGSRLRLDTATRVDVAYYRDRRVVRLAEGQAVFSVQADPARPLEVLAGPLRITVVGTRFSVRHTPGMAGNDGVRVAVEEGRIQVARAVPDASRDGTGTPVFLSAGQQIASDAQGVLMPVAALSTAGIAPWRDDRVSFDNTRLDHVLAELERYGQTGLVVRDPAVASLRITGTFHPKRLDSFAQLLPQAAPVRLRPAAGGTEIVRAP